GAVGCLRPSPDSGPADVSRRASNSASTAEGTSVSRRCSVLSEPLFIHEGAGLVKVTALAGLVAGVGGTVAPVAEAVQSSIRPRGAGRSVSRGSRAQSSGRPSVTCGWGEAIDNSRARSSCRCSPAGGGGAAFGGRGAGGGAGCFFWGALLPGGGRRSFSRARPAARGGGGLAGA